MDGHAVVGVDPLLPARHPFVGKHFPAVVVEGLRVRMRMEVDVRPVLRGAGQHQRPAVPWMSMR